MRIKSAAAMVDAQVLKLKRGFGANHFEHNVRHLTMNHDPPPNPRFDFSSHLKQNLHNSVLFLLSRKSLFPDVLGAKSSYTANLIIFHQQHLTRDSIVANPL